MAYDGVLSSGDDLKLSVFLKKKTKKLNDFVADNLKDDFTQQITHAPLRVEKGIVIWLRAARGTSVRAKST